MIRSRALIALLTLVAPAACFVPAAGGATIVSVNDATPPEVTTFSSAAPGTLLTSLPLSGLLANENVLGIDYDPVDGLTYMVTTDGAQVGRLRTIDPYTGVAGAALVLTADPADLSAPFTGMTSLNADIDVNPVPNRIRLLMNGTASMRINPANGFVTTDGAFSSSSTGVGYTNSVFGAGATTLYTYKFGSDELAIVNPPNNGTLTVVGATGITASGSAAVGMDIDPNGNVGYVAATTGGVAGLYTQDLTSGALTPLGAVADVNGVGDFTVRPNIVTLATTSVVASEGTGGSAIVRLRRQDPFNVTRIDWTATAGTAASSDFTASGTASFGIGVTEIEVPIPVTDDSIDENLETFTVTFAPGVDATMTGVPQLTAARSTTILVGDNDVTVVPPVVPPLPAVPTPATPDTTRPFLFALQPAPASLRSVIRLGLATLVTSSEPVTGAAQLRLGTKLVGTTAFSSTTASLITKRIKLDKVGAALVAKAPGHRVKLALTVNATDTAGNAAAKVSRVVVVTK